MEQLRFNLEPEPFTPDDRQYIDDMLELTGHELAGNINWNSEEHLHRLLTMGLIPQPRRSLARFVIDGWRGRQPHE